MYSKMCPLQLLAMDSYLSILHETLAVAHLPWGGLELYFNNSFSPLVKVVLVTVCL